MRLSDACKRSRAGKRKRRPDEVFTAGPLRAVRFGRATFMESSWPPGEFRKFRARVPELRAANEVSMQSAIAKVVGLVRKYDPFELLAGLFVKNSVVDPTTYEESSSTARENFAEYVFSVFAASKPEELVFEDVDENTGSHLEEALDAVFSAAQHQIILEPDNGANEGLGEFRAQMLLQHLAVRGDSYPDHHVDLIRRLSAPHDARLLECYGFTSSQMIATFQAIEDQVQTRLDQFRELMVNAGEAHKLALAKLDDENADVDASLSEDALRARLLEAVPEGLRRRISDLAAGVHRSGRELLAIELSDPLVTRAVIEACSNGLGDNAAFLEPPFAGYPTKESTIWTKPILKVGEQYYCPSPVVLFRSSLEVLESLLLRDSAYEQQYQAARATALEGMAVEYLSTLLPDAAVGRGLYYTGPDGRRTETDAILVFDRHVIVVEAKAGNLTLPARRGAPKRLKQDFGKIVEDAFSQGIRVREYILCRDEAPFADESGAVVLTLKRRDIDEVHIVNPTLASMNPLGVQLGLAREKGLLSQDARWPWCIFINDLRIVSELIESPPDFFLFLQRRFVLNTVPYAAHDELDLLCKFLADGLYHEKREFRGLTRFSLLGYTDVLDRWYIGRPNGLDVQKPSRGLPAEVRELTRALEATGKEGRTAASIRLLELDQQGLDKIQAFLTSWRPRCAEDGKEHDLSLQFKEPTRGISLYVTPSGQLSASAQQHAAMRKQLSGAPEWLAIAVAPLEGKADFAFLRGQDLNSDVAARVDWIRRDRIANYLDLHGRVPERNAPCPCTSGRKFKKCCMLLPGQ
jgi:hypothetical protein